MSVYNAYLARTCSKASALQWTPGMLLYWLLWPNYVFVSGLSRSLKEAGRYTVHAVLK